MGSFLKAEVIKFVNLHFSPLCIKSFLSEKGCHFDDSGEKKYSFLSFGGFSVHAKKTSLTLSIFLDFLTLAKLSSGPLV